MNLRLRALLWLFRKFYAGEVFTIHINHGIRGSESDEDEKFVVDMATQLGIMIAGKEIHVPKSKLKGESLETAARRLRLKNIIEPVDTLSIPNIILSSPLNY